MPERPFFVGYSTTFVTLNWGSVYTLRQVKPNPVTPDSGGHLSTRTAVLVDG